MGKEPGYGSTANETADCSRTKSEVGKTKSSSVSEKELADSSPSGGSPIDPGGSGKVVKGTQAD